MDKKNLQDLFAHPSAFRKRILIDADTGPKCFVDLADDWQQEDFAAIDPAWVKVVHRTEPPVCQRAYLERPRGHSKTGDIALSVMWALFASSRKLTGVVAAADAEQASLLRQAIDKLVRVNLWLNDFLEVQRSRVVNRITRSELQILTSDALTSYGLTPDFIVCDELTHWAKPELWHSLLSAVAKRTHCLMLIIANAGFHDSWQWEVREKIRQDPDWYFRRLDGPTASWIGKKQLAEQQRLLPAIAYNRLWLNQWSAGAGDALSHDDIDAAVKPGVVGPIPAEKGWVYVAGVDLGLARDASAVVVLGKHVGHSEEIRTPTRLGVKERAMIELGLMESPTDKVEYRHHEATNRLKVVAINVWKPTPGKRVQVGEIETALLRLNETYRLGCVAADPWQAEYLLERLRDDGVPAMPVTFTGQNLVSMCTATLEAFNEGYLDLYQHDQLISDLRALRVVEKQYGVRLESPRGPSGHGDVATALAIGLHTIRSFVTHAPSNNGEPLVCYP